MSSHASGDRVVYLGSTRVGPTPTYQNLLHLQNYLDEDLQMFLRPLNLSRYILLTSRYSVRDNFITPNSRRYNICSFFVTFCFVIIYTTVLIFNGDMKYIHGLLKVIFIISHVSYIIGSGFNAVFNAIRSDAHVLIIINIQRLLKSLKFGKINNRFIIGNWIYVSSVYIFYIILSVIRIYLGDFSVTLFMCYVVLLLADMNILYMIRIMKLLTRSISLSITELTHREFVTNNEDRTMEERIYVGHWDMIFNRHLNILDCLNVYRKLNEVTSFTYMYIIFLSSLTNVQLLIEHTLNNILTPIMASMWLLKQTIVLFQLCFGSERLDVKLKNSQVTLVMKIADTESLSTLASYKRLLRASRDANPRNDGLISVNATLPFTLISVIVTYAVVLLQIAFT